MKAIEEWTGADAQRFRSEIRGRSRPAVLRGAVRQWPAVAAGLESPQALADYLRRHYNGHAAPAFEGPPDIGGRFFYNESLTGFNFQSRRMLLSEVLERLLHTMGDSQAPALYSGSVSIPLYLPGFSATNNAFEYVGSDSRLESIWIGNRTCIAPHFDNTENIACVVGGRRRFTVFPPDQMANLYVGPLDLTPAGQPVSLVDVRNPDHDRFPRYRAAMAAGEVAQLEPGDAICLPALWWHGVEALDDFNVLVNYWWRDVPAYFESPSTSLLHSLLTIKGLPADQRAGWRHIFDYLIFQPDGEALQHLPVETRGLFGDLTPEKAERLRALLLQNLTRKPP